MEEINGEEKKVGRVGEGRVGRERVGEGKVRRDCAVLKILLKALATLDPR